MRITRRLIFNSKIINQGKRYGIKTFISWKRAYRHEVSQSINLGKLRKEGGIRYC
jgi:hypothetical protein